MIKHIKTFLRKSTLLLLLTVTLVTTNQVCSITECYSVSACIEDPPYFDSYLFNN